MKDNYLEQWLLKAENDLKIINHEMRLDESEWLNDILCFHCQQAVEKYLKAFLIFKKIEFSKTHNIEYLLKKCSMLNKEFDNIDVRDLSLFSVDVRYPDEFYIPSIQEVKFYFKLAKKIKKLVLEIIQ